MDKILRITPLIIILATIFIYKWTLFYKFDPVYFKDYYEHSQWGITLSPRILGDEGLYQYSGYQLALGNSPYNISPEVPPLGKYLYGISILLFDNPYLPIIPIYLLTTVIFYKLTSYYFSNKRSRLISTIFLLVSPLFFYQYSQTMMELPQLCFLLMHIFFLFKLINEKRSKAFIYSLIAGFSLGAFYATKIGFLVSVIILADLYLLIRFKKIKYLISIIVSSLLIYFLSYIKYFLDGNSILEWFTGQKYVYKYYLNSQVHPILGMVFLSLLFGVFKGWWGSGWEKAKEWNVLVAFGAIILISKLKKLQFKTLTPYYKYLVILCLSIIFLYIIISFWFRYLALVLPFLIILTVKFLEGKNPIYIKLLSVILVIQALFFVSFQPNGDLKSISSLWEKGLYQDLYDFQTSNISRNEFYLNNLNFDSQIQVEEKKITVKTPFVFPWQSKTTTVFSINYKTGAGELTRATPVIIVKVDNKWKISDWSNLFFGYNFGDKVIMTLSPVTDGVLKTKDGLILSKTGEEEFISIIPNLVNGEEIFKDLGMLTGQDNLKLRARTYVLYPGDWKVPIGFVKPGVNPVLIDKLSKNPAVTIEKRQTRIYNQELVESGFYLRIFEIEAYYPQLKSKVGGKIEVTHQEKTTKIFSSKAINGQDVTLDRDSSDIFPELKIGMSNHRLKNVK